MPISNIRTAVAGSSNNAFGGAITTAAMATLADDIVVVAVVFTDANPAGNLTITNSGTAMTWTLIADVAVNGFNRVAAWWARSAGAESRTATVNWDSGQNLNWGLFTALHAGGHASAPVPLDKVYSGSGSTGVSQAITPTSAGSALWLLAADAATSAGTVPSTFAAGTNCAIERAVATDQWDAVLVRPAVQPRPDTSAFTLSETHAGNAVAWLAFEVQSAASGGGTLLPLLAMHHRKQQGIC
ncbi:hypothetical protein [Azohydromonas aeria]|uniref:hypothetical protein n=1 Tax=Azohydromonas aeria TaxID=2590212 RepID=UPI0012F91244|nr:hypothetical protein [Azohydromonas aeria]